MTSSFFNPDLSPGALGFTSPTIIPFLTLSGNLIDWRSSSSISATFLILIPVLGYSILPSFSK